MGDYQNELRDGRSVIDNICENSKRETLGV